MTHILITGLSGTGKSTVLNVLASRGYATVDTDDPGWCRPADDDWSSHDATWIWDIQRLEHVLDDHANRHLVIAGTRPNQGELYHRFDHIVVLMADLETMLERLASRSNNPYGKSPEERKAIIEQKASIEPLLTSTASLIIDTSSISPDTVADQLESFLTDGSKQTLR